MSDERSEDLVREGMEHVHAAAHEMIRAARSLLDAAEELLDDPTAVQALGATLASLASAAATRLRPPGEPASGPPGEGHAGDDARIQRIRVS